MPAPPPVQSSNMTGDPPQQVGSRSHRSVFPAWLANVSLMLIVGLTGFSLLTSRYGWKIYLEVFSHFQLQYLIGVLILLPVLIASRRKVLIGVGLVCSLLIAGPVLSWYWPPHWLQSADQANFRVFLVNVNTQNQSYDRVLTLVEQEDPDLAVFIEVDQAWTEQIDSLRSQLPYAFGRAHPYNLGMAVYSRSPLQNPQIEFFGTERNACVLADLIIHDRRVALITAHPFPPVKPSFFHARNRQLDQIGQYIQANVPQDQQPVSTPVLLLGDLNLTMWSPYYQRLIRQTHLSNARQGFGLLPSWPTPGTYPLPDGITRMLSIPIDHCLLSHELKVVDVRIGDPIGSDHFPLIVDLQI